ncbi:hypothetical protein XAC908_610063 [Xanthomonas citri pv. citri]|nr:hypothetical protein XAC908_610063 [Xanthomonas citri pv. citri]
MPETTIDRNADSVHGTPIFNATDCPFGVYRDDGAFGGCKPEPQKIPSPSPQFQPRHERIQIDQVAVTLEGVMRRP